MKIAKGIIKSVARAQLTFLVKVELFLESYLVLKTFLTRWREKRNSFGSLSRATFNGFSACSLQTDVSSGISQPEKGLTDVENFV